ncbi:MAG TPA: hypothetical protein VF797_22470 [Noviherbaspirillum sp.]
MKDIEKLYFSNPISNCANGNGSNFDEDAINAVTPDQKIDDFVKSATRPLRARQSRSRPGMVCVYQIGHFEHLLEKLGFVFYDNQQRRREAHLAIETCIRPLLDQANPGDKAVRLDKLHALVEQKAFNCAIVAANQYLKNQAPTAHKTNTLELTTSRTVGNAILVPDGISIVGAKASDVIADRVVRAADFTQGLDTQYFFSRSEQQDDSPGNQAEEHYITTLSKHIEAQLEENAGAKLIVFEMKYENDEEKELKNWKAAYDAAKKVRTASGGMKSIMLVPSSAEVFKRNLGDGSASEVDKKEVLQEIQKLLNEANQQQTKNPVTSNPYACLDE